MTKPPSPLTGPSFPPCGFDGNHEPPRPVSAPSTFPIRPMTIAPETDFVLTTNVFPVVNVLPTDVNDYSFAKHPDYGYSGDYGNYGNNYENNDGSNQVFRKRGGRI
ncbi:hypothetical protein BGZ52_007308 [Haplosporangium bisporale]|nr:hypothetical protein BGZ52_007308 [Haplosporangium bisporale]